MTNTMSAFGTKRTSLVAVHMSAFGGKPDTGGDFPDTGLTSYDPCSEPKGRQ